MPTKKHTLYDDGTMLGKYKVSNGLNVQAAPESHSCNLTLHDKISEAHSLSDQNIGKNKVDIQKRSCKNKIQTSKPLGKRERNIMPIRRITVSVDLQLLRAFLLSVSGKIPLCSQDQEVNDSFGVLPEQDLMQ